MRIISFLIFLFFTTGNLLLSCSFPHLSPMEEREDLTLILPQWPPKAGGNSNYPALSRWLIEIEGTGDSEASQLFFTQETEITVSLKKNSPAAITALPLTKTEDEEVIFFKAAGLIYPAKKTYLTWEGGYLADCMQRLILSKTESGITEQHIEEFLSRFNWKRAQEIIDRKLSDCLKEDSSKKDFYNPWLNDDLLILESISFAEFDTELLNNSGCSGLDFDSWPEEVERPQVILSSFILENAFIQKKKRLLIKKESSNMFYSQKDYAIIIEGQSAKNLSLSYCKLPIFIDKTLYEENITFTNTLSFSNNSKLLFKKRE